MDFWGTADDNAADQDATFDTGFFGGDGAAPLDAAGGLWGGDADFGKPAGDTFLSPSAGTGDAFSAFGMTPKEDFVNTHAAPAPVSPAPVPVPAPPVAAPAKDADAAHVDGTAVKQDNAPPPPAPCNDGAAPPSQEAPQQPAPPPAAAAGLSQASQPSGASQAAAKVLKASPDASHPSEGTPSSQRPHVEAAVPAPVSAAPPVLSPAQAAPTGPPAAAAAQQQNHVLSVSVPQQKNGPPPTELSGSPAETTADRAAMEGVAVRLLAAEKECAAAREADAKLGLACRTLRAGADKTLAAACATGAYQRHKALTTLMQCSRQQVKAS
eukprot:TRINITY_DN6148_c0_g1_i1.p1 TRINITY_DN6148_c0_g1~~TRINITY_DN6148_c0_g1_i1.p1  ORF type:complete len:325 (+),score=93.81 TRINITY_DN6148_c0_g1_i1:75-1049(+)